MRFHWYMPYLRADEMEWARHTARPGEEIVAQCIDRSLAPPGGVHGSVTVLRNLPQVEHRVSGVARWVGSRVRTYAARELARRRLWEQLDFDLIHIHYLNRFTDSVAPLPRPLVMSVHDVVPHKPRVGPAEDWILRRMYNRADALVVHHERLGRRLIGDFGISPGRVHVVPHEVFPAPLVERPTNIGPPTLLFFGSLRPNKGLTVLANAIERLGPVELQLIIAGHGDHAVEIEAQRLAERDSRVAVELGFVSLERKHELFAMSSLVVLPYTAFASQSGVLHDAYAHGRPVVVSDVGALGEAVREDGTGLVCRPGDAEDLAKQIQAALDPDRWAELASASASIRESRSPMRTGERLRSVYDTVL